LKAGVGAECLWTQTLGLRRGREHHRRRASGAGVAVNGDRDVLIALTDGQVAQVVRGAASRMGLAGLLPEVNGLDMLRSVVLPLLEDATYSRSTLRALLALAAFPADGSEHELTDVARQLGFSPGTTHRYVCTWMAVGLLEQDPRSRRYRRVPADHACGELGTARTGGGRDAG